MLLLGGITFIGADEGEFSRPNTVRREAFAPAQQERVDDQHSLVDESVFEQKGRRRRTTPDYQVRAVL
jgi:hypothetical protein